MQTIVNDILDKFNSLSIEEQESILEIEKKRLIERKREMLVQEVREAEKEYTEAKYIEDDADTLMSSIKLNEILSLSKNEKLELIEALWKSMSEEIKDSEIPEWHKKILDERLKKIENGEMEFVSWEKVKEMLQERMK